jgi:hypothetical protein
VYYLGSISSLQHYNACMARCLATAIPGQISILSTGMLFKSIATGTKSGTSEAVNRSNPTRDSKITSVCNGARIAEYAACMSDINPTFVRFVYRSEGCRHLVAVWLGHVFSFWALHLSASNSKTIKKPLMMR